MVTSASRLLVIAVAAAGGAALAQSARELVPLEAEQRLLGQIGELRSQEGLYAEELVEPLQGLGLLYQEAGDHVRAALALQEARQILRANRGLFSSTVDEALLLRQQVRSEKELGNGERAWSLQHDMIIIARQHLDDMRMLPVFLELIEDRAERLDAFSTTSYKELPAGIYVPCSNGVGPTPINSGRRAAPVPVSDARNCEFGTWRTVVDRLQGAVLRNYADAIAVLIRNRDYASQELRDLEKEALALVPFERGFVNCSIGRLVEFIDSELVDSCLDPAGGSPGVQGAGVGGWASLMRLVYYEVRSGAAATARARAYAELGDWYLRTIHIGAPAKFSPADEIALTLYEQAIAELSQEDNARESVAQIFTPDVPVMLPTYATNRLASEVSSRFIDVAFTIDRHGKAAEIEILDSGANATGVEERAVVRLIKFGSFRPRTMDGELADSAPVVLRYYLPDNSGVGAVSGPGSGADPARPTAVSRRPDRMPR